MPDDPRVGERRLTWPDRAFYFAVFLVLAWVLFFVGVPDVSR
ncbi:MAG TPA: hypothetical protein VGH38_10185 [Bryobacteraceae bacterium]